MTARVVAIRVLMVGLMSTLLSFSAMAEALGAAQGAGSGWDAKWFAYDAPDELVVAEETPTVGQIDYNQRPRQVRERGEDLRSHRGRAKPRAAGPMDVVHLRFVDAFRDVVPALLCTPKGKTGPFPVVVAVHGLTSNKAQVCAQVGPALVGRGFAVLAADMPRHGERPGDPRTVLDRSNPFQAFELFKQAVVDVRQLIDLAETRPELDTRRGVAAVGYSMGSWIHCVAGPSDGRVKAMVLMVGGAHDLPPAALLLPQLMASDPRMAIAHFAPRPVLMLCGRRDYTVTRDMSERLYAAAEEPKEIRWYDSGHLLTEDAYDDAAQWIAETIKKRK